MIMSTFDSSEDALKDLAQITAYPTPTMNEADFVKFLLPLIVNQDGVKNLDMTIWLTIAGNAHRKIDVIDPSNNVLFTVPPLLARVPTHMPAMNRDRPDINAMVHHYSAMRQVEHPATADAWFANAMEGAVVGIDDGDNVDNLKMLVAIYSRYNISLERLLPGSTLSTTIPNTPVSPQGDTTGEFDDF
jgi:hypothetical protein